MTLLKSFFADEEGAVTVDWVILTAGIVILAVAVATAIQPAVDTELLAIADGVKRAEAE